MIRIAVVDDDEIFAEKLHIELKSLFQGKNIICNVSYYVDSEFFFEEHSSNPFDLIYLDIDMPKITGIKLASMIRKNKTLSVHLIFVSSYSHFVFDTFQYMPYRFIRKEKLSQELKESVNAYCEEVYAEKQIVELQFENNIIDTEDVTRIVYIYSLRHDIFLRCINESKRLANRTYTMEYLEELMKQYGFIRIHKTYLVNYKYIYQIRDNAVILKHESKSETLPLSARRYSLVKEQFKLLTRGGDAL